MSGRVAGKDGLTDAAVKGLLLSPSPDLTTGGFIKIMNDAKDIFGDEPDTDEIQEAPKFDAVIDTKPVKVVVEHKTVDNDPRPASVKQKNYIYKLLKVKGQDVNEAQIDSLSMRAASKTIDRLLALPDQIQKGRGG